MKNLILVLSLSLSFSCSHIIGHQNESSTKYNILQKENLNTGYTTGSGHVKIQYKDYEQTKHELSTKIKNEALNEEDNSLNASLSKGGIIIISIFRGTVESGN